MASIGGVIVLRRPTILILTGNMMQTDRLMAGVVVVSVLGLAMSMLISAVERRLLRWR